MEMEVRNMILAVAIVVGLAYLLRGLVSNDNLPHGFADSFNDWQAKNYRVINGKYYRINPPNTFESEKVRRKRYREYCYRENRRRSHGE